MKPTNNLTVSISRTIILLLGIAVAILLTLNSGVIGDMPTLTSGFPRFFAENQPDDFSTMEKVEQAKSMIIAGKNLYQQAADFLNNK